MQKPQFTVTNFCPERVFFPVSEAETIVFQPEFPDENYPGCEHNTKMRLKRKG
jgi:hypothetical protein